VQSGEAAHQQIASRVCTSSQTAAVRDCLISCTERPGGGQRDAVEPAARRAGPAGARVIRVRCGPPPRLVWSRHRGGGGGGVLSAGRGSTTTATGARI